MTEYRATLGDWENLNETARLGKSVGYYALRCILELRSRIEQLEEDAIEHSDSNVFCFNAMVKRIEALEQRPIPGTVELTAAPAGGLVERVADTIANAYDPADHSDEARAAILACATWLDGRGHPTPARWLREEVEHG